MVVRSLIAHLVLRASFGLTLIIARLGRALRGRPQRPCRRIVVIGTFHNPNWFLSHLRPLRRSGVDEVIVVCDQPQAALDGVRFFCPPRWAAAGLGRALSKLVWLILAGIRFSPELYMGFHIFPGALSALIAARILGGFACYQMTGGPLEIEGGGFNNENKLMNSLGRFSPDLERLEMRVVREFDLVVVRGSKAKRFLAERGMNGTVRIITGSVPECTVPSQDRSISLIFIGRMTAIKQPDQFVRIVAAVSRTMPQIRAAMVGTGPELQAVRDLSIRLEVGHCLQFFGQRSDIPDLLTQARLYVLTSRSEGLSIAMAEAMSLGVPPVVADVGELSDLVSSGVNGWLVPPGDIDAYARHIVALLSDRARWERFSQAARGAALRMAATESVSRRWAESLNGLAGEAAASGRLGRVSNECEQWDMC